MADKELKRIVELIDTLSAQQVTGDVKALAKEYYRVKAFERKLLDFIRSLTPQMTKEQVEQSAALAEEFLY